VCNSKFKSGLNKKHCSKACANKLKIGSKYKTGPRKDKVTTQRFLKSRLVALRGEFCERCSYSNQKILNIHHKIRRKDGGSDDLDNLELLCPNCHAEEHYGK
jgi:5-methylcytosine-specific restriction endonuclease McrA